MKKKLLKKKKVDINKIISTFELLYKISKTFLDFYNLLIYFITIFSYFT